MVQSYGKYICVLCIYGTSLAAVCVCVCGFKGKQSQKHELMSVIWINVVIDMTGADESEAEQIIDYTVHLLQQE